MKMAAEEEEYRRIYAFLAHHRYPLGFGKNEKRSLRRKCVEHYCLKRGLLRYSRLSTSDAKKRHLNQEWRQVPRSEEDKKGILHSCHSSAEGMIVRVGYLEKCS